MSTAKAEVRKGEGEKLNGKIQKQGEWIEERITKKENEKAKKDKYFPLLNIMTLRQLLSGSVQHQRKIYDRSKTEPLTSLEWERREGGEKNKRWGAWWVGGGKNKAICRSIHADNHEHEPGGSCMTTLHAFISSTDPPFARNTFSSPPSSQA